MGKLRIARQVVITTEPPGYKIWGFGYESYAQLFNVSTKTIKRWIDEGKFNPLDLQSVCDLYNKLKTE
jgi:hypothetical protein